MKYFLCIVALLSGCSFPLKVSFINRSAQDLKICSIDESKSNQSCENLAANSMKTIDWDQGKFTVATSGKVMRYSAIIPKPIDAYKDQNIRIIIDSNFNLLIAKRDQTLDSVSEQDQPQGYPLKPQ